MREVANIRINRRALLIGSLTTIAGTRNPLMVIAESRDHVIHVPYLSQGGSGSEEKVNCGPTVVAMAVNYSGASFPSVSAVRSTLALSGPTDINQWARLLDVYGVSWYPTWSQDDIMVALLKGHPVVIASWMAEFSAAADFEQPGAAPALWEGRYCDYAEGHALIIVGLSADKHDFLVHDPNVFPGDPTHYYSDGSPKGQYRRYQTSEVWRTVSNYAGGMGIAVAPVSRDMPPAIRVKRVDLENTDIDGPGGGQTPRREAAEFK